MIPVLTMLITSDPVNTLPHVSIRMYQGSDPIIRRLYNESHVTIVVLVDYQKVHVPQVSLMMTVFVERTNFCHLLLNLIKVTPPKEAFVKY